MKALLLNAPIVITLVIISYFLMLFLPSGGSTWSTLGIGSFADYDPSSRIVIWSASMQKTQIKIKDTSNDYPTMNFKAWPTKENMNDYVKWKKEKLFKGRKVEINFIALEEVDGRKVTSFTFKN